MRLRHRVPIVLAVALAAVLTAPGAAEIADRLDQPAAPLECTRWWNGEKPPKLSRAPERAILLHLHDPTRITSKAFEGTIKAFAQEHADDPIDVIEILVDCDEADAESYVARSGATWLVGHDGKGDTGAAYMGSSVPRTYLIGPDGNVAWHAHIGALTDELVDAQIRRARWYEDDLLTRKTKPVAKAARELRFGKAVVLAQKLRDDLKATDAEKQLAQDVLDEVPRYHAFQTERVEKLIDSRDWGIALRRAEYMAQIYKGTHFEKDVKALIARIEEDPRAIAAFDGERDLAQIISEIDTRKRKSIEEGIDDLERFATAYENYRVAERAWKWVESLRKRLAEMEE